MFFVAAAIKEAVESAIQGAYGEVGLAGAGIQVIETRRRDVLYFEVPDGASKMVRNALSVEGINFASSPLLIHLTNKP